MSQVFERLFKIKERGSNLRNEIIGGLVIFVAMCYILPVNSQILSDMGMDKSGVFAMTALVGAVVTLIMGLVANYPVVLSAGMGLNAFIAYSISSDYNWQQRMLLLTIAGILFFLFSLTPVRKIIIEAIPKGLKAAISAGLGAFICFVGLKNSGIISANASTYVGLGNLADPGVLIAILCVFLCFGLMFVKNKMIASLAIPISIGVCAIAGLITFLSLYHSGNLVAENGAFNTSLPIAPWLDNNASFGMDGIKNVVFFGVFGNEGYSINRFGDDLVFIFSQPESYVAIFSLMFVNLFDTTATLLAVGNATNIIDENGKMRDSQKVILADATGALICAPLGTSTVTSFAESNVGAELGAKTGLAAVVAALLFVLSSFIYPVFSIFTSGSVTAPALICVGALIFVNNFKQIGFDDRIMAFTGFIVVVFSLLTYSVANGIGIGLIAYIIMMLIGRRHREIHLSIYIIGCLFVVSFALTALMPYLR